MSARLAPMALAALCEARRAEREQTRFYRALAAEAEALGDAALAERLNGLLADEQHHFSRISARLLELGASCPDEEPAASTAGLSGWEAVAREREAAELHRYQALLAEPLDERTRAMVVEFRATEAQHHALLGGKWMRA